MPLKGATLVSGATLSGSGGTAKTFTEMGETLNNGVKITDLSVSDARLRPVISAVNRPAKLGSAGVYISRDKRTLKLTFPKILASGVINYSIREIRMEDHPEVTDAEKSIIDGYVAQMMFDADFTSFRNNGSLA